MDFADPNPTPHRRESKPARAMRYTFIAFFLALFLSPFCAVGLIMIPGPITEAQTVVIPHGTSTREIGGLLAQNGVIYNGTLFALAARGMAGSSLRAGEYQFTPGQSIADIVLMMHDGRSVVHMFTVAEGLTSAEIVNLLNNTPALSGDIGEVPAEGSMLPETYRYSYGDGRAAMIARMQKGMRETLAALWATRDPALPLTAPEQTVIMASVIEKETGKAVERPRIAGVFYNRLHTGMRLQSDPTVIYAIVHAKGAMDHELTHDDLSFPSPINTYASDGLPSQPICNPGRASLEAALHPETNEYLYFVADGSGGHVFSRDLAEHNQNVARYRSSQNLGR